MKGVKISQLLPPPKTVSTGVGEFEVNGLTLPQVTKLISRHKTEFARLLVMGADGQPNYAEIVDVAPQMVSEIIAMAAGVADEFDEVQAIGQLPAGVQLIALSEIWRLTVVDPKNFQALLQTLIERARDVYPVKLQGSPEGTSEGSPLQKETS